MHLATLVLYIVESFASCLDEGGGNLEGRPFEGRRGDGRGSMKAKEMVLAGSGALYGRLHSMVGAIPVGNGRVRIAGSPHRRVSTSVLLSPTQPIPVRPCGQREPMAVSVRGCTSAAFHRSPLSLLKTSRLRFSICAARRITSHMRGCERFAGCTEGGAAGVAAGFCSPAPAPPPPLSNLLTA